MHTANPILSRHPRIPLRLAILLAVGGVGGTAATSAQAQWTVINLHPAGAVESQATGVNAGQQVGFANAVNDALLWTGAAPSVMRLNPLPGSARIDGVSAGMQSGLVTVEGNSHGALWSGTAQSWVDLHPSNPNVLHSRVLGMDGATQVGLYFIPDGGMFSLGSACMWNSTSESWLPLNPPGFLTSEARGVFGNQQVGATFDSFFGQAGMWTGTAESFVSLNPPEALFSVAQCTDGVHQYGAIGVLEPVIGIFPCRWSGTAESWENMGVPEGRRGGINAVHDGYQVGASTNEEDADEHAFLWTGTPGSYVDLNQFLPVGYTTSSALGIWRHAASGTTYVVGYAVNSATTRTEAMMWVLGPGTNLITSPGSPADCTSTVGEPIDYSVRVLNAGPDASGPVTLTIDLPPASVATYMSAVPAPTSVTATQLTFDLSPLAGSGAFTDVSITLTAASAGATSTITASATTAGEADPTNNTASASSRILPVPPLTAVATGLISTDPALANSLIPGGAGRYTAINRPLASPSGNWWIARADTDLPTTQDFVYLRSQTGGTPAILVQEGVTPTSNGILSQMDVGAEISDSGDVALAGDDNGPSATNRFIAVISGASITDIAREGQAIPSMPGINYGSSVGASANIFAGGQTGFFTTSAPAGSSAYLSDNGNTIIAQLNVTAPDGETPIDTMVTNTSGTNGVAFDASGTHSIYQADINTGIPDNDQVIVADGVIVMQEATTVLPGLLSPVGGGSKVFTMGAGGTWFVRGSNIDAAEDWVALGAGSTVSRVFKNGDPIHAGATEIWREDAVITSTFFAHTADAAGNYVIGGMTDNADSFTDAVLVYNDEAVLVRENDPVDLNGNGAFDDGVYIRSIDSDGIAIIADGVLLTVTLRDAEAALCRTNDTSRGQALIRVDLPAPPCPADFDGNGTVQVPDIFAFLSAWFAMDPSADFDGVGGIAVPDIFAFLSAWFAGCP